MNIAQHQKAFLEYLQYEKRFSVHTLVAYTNDINQFVIYLQKTYDIHNVEDVKHIVIRSWVVSLMENQISSRSVNRKITTLKTFYRFLLRQEVVQENPMLKIQAPKTSKRLPTYVEKDKMDYLFDNIKFEENIDGMRNKLIMELFYATGMRLSELINLKQSNVDVDNCQMKVIGKRNKERIIPFNNILKESITGYLFAKGTTNDEFLFVNKSGNRLYEKYVYRLVNNYLSQVTTVGKKSPHVLRHTFATHMLNNGADLNAIKELLGHANLSATQVYTHNTVEKLKNIHKQAHPKS